MLEDITTHVEVYFPAVAIGFLKTKITESPLRNILAMYLSLLTGFAFFPFPDLGVSVHISLTFSRTMLQCLSNAFTLASSFLLFRQLIRTWVLFFTDCVKTDKGPVLNSSCSLWASSSGVISLFGLAILRRKGEESRRAMTDKPSWWQLQLCLRNLQHGQVRLQKKYANVMITNSKKISFFLQGCHFSSEIFYDYNFVLSETRRNVSKRRCQAQSLARLLYAACAARLCLVATP